MFTHTSVGLYYFSGTKIQSDVRLERDFRKVGRTQNKIFLKVNSCERTLVLHVTCFFLILILYRLSHRIQH